MLQYLKIFPNFISQHKVEILWSTTFKMQGTPENQIQKLNDIKYMSVFSYIHYLLLLTTNTTILRSRQKEDKNFWQHGIMFCESLPHSSITNSPGFPDSTLLVASSAHLQPKNSCTDFITSIYLSFTYLTKTIRKESTVFNVANYNSQETEMKSLQLKKLG